MELFSELETNNKLQGKLGLKNYGDSSFVNAIVQAISNIEPVCFAIREMPVDLPKSIGGIEDGVERTKRMNICYSFRRILRELWKDKRMLVEPAVLLRRMNEVEILKDSVSNKNIEDTFLYLLEALHDALMQPVPALYETRVNFKPTAPIWELISLNKDIEGDYQKALERGALETLAYQRSIITDTFQGIIVSAVTCPCCTFQEQSLDPFFSLSLDVVCQNDKNAKKNAFKSAHFMANASAINTKSKKSRKIYMEDVGSDKAAKRGPRLKSGGKTSLLRTPNLKPISDAAPLLSPHKVVPIEGGENGDVPTCTLVGVPSAPFKSQNSSIDKGELPVMQEGTPFRKSLAPLPASTVTAGMSKSKKFIKSDSAKRLISKSSGSSDNIDSRIDMELSQSSSESNPNLDSKRPIVHDVVNNAKLEESKSSKSELHQKMRLEALANKRQQRQHQVNLSTLSAAQIAAKNKRRGSLMFSFKNSKSSGEPKLLNKFEKTSAFLRSSKQMTSNVAAQAKVAMDLHTIGQKAVLHDCIRSQLADEVIADYTCQKCGEVNVVTKNKRIANAPEVLVFYFKRFLKSGFFQTKENTLVHFPLENFDVSDFLEMSSGYFKGGWDQQAIYDLQVLVRHVGKNKDSNHYSTLARHDPEGKWFEYHDHRVRVVSKRYVTSREALMLFYVRRKPVKGQQVAVVANLRQVVRNAILERREAVVDEINYMHRMDYIHEVNVLKTNLTQKTNKLVLSMKKSLQTSVKMVMFITRTSKSIGNSDDEASRESRKKNFLSLASFAEVVMSDAKISTRRKRLLSPHWRLVRKSLQKIVLLGEDPSLTYDHANIILEIPPRKHIFVSIYWLIKFLSFSEPGPLCNHDIACCHGSLKPHLYGCRKRVCIPVHLSIFKNLRDYLHEKFNYPRCLLSTEKCSNNIDAAKSNEISFRELTSTIPCEICIRHHDQLMLRRKEERERVVTESIKDGFEEELLSEEDIVKVKKIVQLERRRRELDGKLHSLIKEGSGKSVQSDDDFGVVLSSLRRRNIDIRPVDEIKYYCIISKSWLETWKRFCLSGQYEDIEYPYPLPGPINNFDLLVAGSSSDIKPNLVLEQDYCALSPGVWNVLHDIYGGGPVLCREDVNIYSSHSGSEKVGMIIC